MDGRVNGECPTSCTGLDRAAGARGGRVRVAGVELLRMSVRRCVGDEGRANESEGLHSRGAGLTPYCRACSAGTNLRGAICGELSGV